MSICRKDVKISSLVWGNEAFLKRSNRKVTTTESVFIRGTNPLFKSLSHVKRIIAYGDSYTEIACIIKQGDKLVFYATAEGAEKLKPVTKVSFFEMVM